MTPPPEGTEGLREALRWLDSFVESVDANYGAPPRVCHEARARLASVRTLTSVAPAEPATNPSPNSTELVARSETPTAGIGEKPVQEAMNP